MELRFKASLNVYILQHNKQHHSKVLLSTQLSFGCPRHTLGFHPQTKKLEQTCTAYKIAPQERTSQ